MMETPDRWAAGHAYEQFMGRWSREIAPKFVDWLQAKAGDHWLDVGCGTGALTEAICRTAHPASVIGCDPSKPFIEHVTAHLASDRVSFVIAGAGSLPRRPGGFGSVTSSLVLNFIPAPARAVAEMREVCVRGGTVSALLWDYAGRMELLRHFWDAATRLDATAVRLDEGRRFPICRPDALTSLFQDGGLDTVRCEPLEIDTVFRSFDDAWQSFQWGSGPAPAYVASLDEAHRAALAEELERSLPTRADGSIRLVARAWAARGEA